VVWFAPHDSGIVEVLHTILVLSSAHNCAHASVSGHLNIGWTSCVEQRSSGRSERSEMEKGGEKLSE
jgi:hypothetical protein